MEPSNNSRRINDASNFHPQYVDNITQHFDRMYVSPFSLNTPFFPTPYIGNNYRYIWKQLETGSEEKAYVTHISGDGPASFYVMLQNDFENACPVLTSGIMNTLKGNIYEGIVPGKPCLAYDFNNILGRGMVMIVKDTKAEVFFVDYGYTREIPLTEIYDIPVEYVMSPSAMAIHVKLAKLDSKLTTEEGKKIFLDILNKDNFVTIRVTEREEPGKQFVELFLDDRGTLKNIKEKLQLPKFHKITLSKGNRYEVNISHCDSINVICVQLAASANVSSLQRLMSKLQSYCQNAGFDKCLTMDELYKGMPVCALFSDNKWYRAEILKTTNDPQAIPIAYVDYGNEELVSLESLKKIDPELIKFRAQAINCYLLADNDDLQENGLAFETYSDLVVDQKFVMEVTEVLRDMFIVQLTDENDIPVSELLRIKLQSLTEPEPALSIVNRLLNSQDISNKQKTRLLTGFQRGMKFIEFNPSIGFSNEVSVTWFANPRSFFVRIITEEFDDLIRDIQNTYDKREPLSEGEIHVNDCVVARSSDGFVHRGRITAVNESDSSDVTIFFVDLGEECSCKANEIWAISEEHCKIPVKTIYCGLKNISPPTGNDWLDETIDNALPYFSEADKYKLNIVGRFNDEFGTVNEVDLFDDKQRNVAVRLVNNSLARFNEGKKKNQQSNVTNSTTATDNEISRVTNKLPCQQKHSSSGGNRSDSGGKKKNSLQDKPKTQLKPGFPLGVQLTEMNLRKGYSLKVFNTFLVSPSLFCTRVVSDEFDEMMKTIQIEYQQREPLNIKMVHIGDHVMAKCFNGIIYRAQVVHINEHTFEGIKVVSVDYGNEFDCKKNEVWAISRDHSSVPIIGVYCSLRNILPPTGDSWAEEILNSAERYFTGEKQYKIDIAGQFKDCFGTIYEVDLFDDEGRNIAECLINDSLARPKEALTTLEEPIDLKTLVGQFVAVHVSWYESSKNFMVLPEFEKVSCIEETLLEIATDMTKLVKFSKEKIIQEALCLVYDEAFYRGLILSFNHISDEVTVHYIDYGVERKVSSDKLYILPRRLKCYQRQAFPCRLYGFAELSAEREEHLKQSVVNNNFIAYVNDAYDNRLSLTLNNEDGTILNIEEYKDTQPLDPLLPLTVMRPQTIVTVKNIMVEADGLVTAYVALSSDKQVLRNLQELLTNFYNEQRHIDRVEQCRIGSICAVKDSSDNRWLRCKILEKAATSVKVVCVDYGTEINVKYDSLFVLDKKLYYPNALSLKVGTGLKLKMITDDTLREFSQLTREIIVNATEFSTEFSRSNIAGLIWDVNIFYSERDDWPEALYRLCDVSETDRPDIERENIERWYRMGRVPLKVVHVVSPTLFWVQLADDSMAIDSLTNELEESLKLNLPASICDDPTNLKEQPFAVRNRTSTGGGPWYRATTERDRQNNSMIRSVDFGYSFEDAAEQLTIKTLPYSYRVIPHFAIRCSLNVEVTNLDEESAALDLFKRALVASEQLTGEIIVLGDETQTVRLFAGNDNNESDIAGTVFADRFSRRKRHEVYITEMESLDKFFTVNRKLADKMASRLNSPRYLCADNLTHRERNVGDMVLAKLPTCPDEWCRAIVCEFVDPDNYLIRVVDRGYLCYSNKSKRLPDRLRRVPPLAAEYSLDTSGLHINDCKQFDDIVNFVSRKRANVKFKMAVLSFTGEKSLAELYVNNNSLVRDIFGQSASDISENSRYSSYVSYIYSPAHFYVHFENVDTYAITEQLHNAIEEWQPLDSSRVTEGCVVAAQYRDNEWYRAKVLRVPLDGATDYCVRSIDFGDDFETSAIRELPEYLIRLPPLAIHCSLQPPEGRFTEWPESAKAEFDELTNCSETPFEMQVVAKGEPNLVSLRLDGTSVADRLLAVKRLALPTTKAADNHPDAQPVTEEDIVIEEEDYYSSEYLNNCSITNVVSLSEFYISNSICTEIAVNQLLEKCRNSLPNVKINDLVATVPDDGGRGLCRAKVLSTADGITADLLLIDSGKKTERCREFYALPNALIELPALAKRCSLIVPEQSGLTEWPPEAEQVFFARYLSSHSAFKEKLYRVKCETNNFRNDQLNHVQLWLGELDVANDVILHVAHVVDGLKQKSGRDSFKISSTTDSSKNVVNFVDESETSSFITASEGSIDNELTDNELLFDDESVNTIVQISFFDSPASFYVRRTNDTNPICIVEPLEPLDIFELNRLIAAQLNGQWCRAEVLSVTEDNRLLSVRRVDYGDIETVSANSVRKLPEQYLRKPAEAIHCALPGALAVNQWPEDALCKFKTEVISSLATIYEMEIIEKGHLPIIVDLMGIYSTQSLSSQFEKYFNATQ